MVLEEKFKFKNLSIRSNQIQRQAKGLKIESEPETLAGFNSDTRVKSWKSQVQICEMLLRFDLESKSRVCEEQYLGLDSCDQRVYSNSRVKS